MRIACLQFNPQVGDVDNNLTRADRVLSRANPENLDLLVLPEMAFSGKTLFDSLGGDGVA
jgi:protein N-terminal amidase